MDDILALAQRLDVDGPPRNIATNPYVPPASHQRQSLQPVHNSYTLIRTPWLNDAPSSLPPIGTYYQPRYQSPRGGRLPPKGSSRSSWPDYDNMQHKGAKPVNPYAEYALPGFGEPGRTGGASRLPRNPYAPVHNNHQYGGNGQNKSLHDNYGRSFVGGPGPSMVEPPARRVAFPRRELEMLSRFGDLGSLPGQLDSPHGFCLGLEGELIIADTMNNRVQIFDVDGNLLWVWGSNGRKRDRLSQPRKVAFLKDTGRIVVSDREGSFSRLQIFTRYGQLVRILRSSPTALSVGLSVYNDCVVAVENQPASCVVISQDGLGEPTHFSLDKIMVEPSELLVYGDEFFICDFLGHCVCVFSSSGTFLRRIGDSSPGIITYPNGIDMTATGCLLIADTHGNHFHVSVWDSAGNLVGDFELPHMKVSRCCGLSVSWHGNLITAATNSNIVLSTNVLRDSGFNYSSGHVFVPRPHVISPGLQYSPMLRGRSGQFDP